MLIDHQYLRYLKNQKNPKFLKLQMYQLTLKMLINLKNQQYLMYQKLLKNQQNHSIEIILKNQQFLKLHLNQM
jgi:hypothetical protein